MRGFIISLSAVVILAVIFMLIALVFAGLSGGTQSGGLFGWKDTPFLAGIETFITGVYNVMVVISSWVTIFVLFTVLLGVQGIFIYLYLKLGQVLWSVKDDINRILDELLDV
jgi:hypothetical protein